MVCIWPAIYPIYSCNRYGDLHNSPKSFMPVTALSQGKKKPKKQKTEKVKLKLKKTRKAF